MMELWLVKISIGIIFLNYLLASVRSFFNLKKVNNLYCGIYGFSLKQGADKRSALNKLKILGIYNISRGRDASGIFIDGEIIKKTEEFDNFIEEEILSEDFENRVVLGHNRQGSVGYKKTIDEAHPFIINESLVFTHNGTIKNTGDLCKKYSIDEKDFNVDSKVLGTLLYTEGSEILTQYKGYAALAYTHLDTPNTLYLFHGRSKEYKAGAELEERPLFFMETKDGIFYSSLESSLKAIRESEEEEPKNLAYNRIFKIEDGEFLLDDTVEIERSEANVFVYVSPNTDYYGDFYYNNRYAHYNRSRVTKPVLPSVGSNSDIDYTMILKESYPIKLVDAAKTDFKIFGNDFVYSHMGRYWTPPRVLVNGPIYLKKGGLISNHADKSAELFYFFSGVLLKDKEAYERVLELSKVINGTNWVNTPKNFNFAMEISKYSVYPVTNLPAEYNSTMSKEYTHRWYQDKFEKKNASFTPRFSGRSYTIKDCFLIGIKSAHREKCVLASMYEVERQFNEIMSRRVPGGSPALLLPFRTQDDPPNKPENNSNSEENLWFFEVVYKSLEDFLKVWGELELRAFKKFLAHTHKRDFYLEATEKEILSFMNDIIKETIDKNISVSDFLEKESKGESNLFFDFYEKELDSNNLVTSKISSTSQIEDILDLNDENTKDIEIKEIEESLEEEAEREENVNDTVENCIISLEDMQASSFDLVDEQNSDFAQEVAKIVLTGSENILSNLLQPLHTYGKDELIRRVNKIRETKNLENGIL